MHINICLMLFVPLQFSVYLGSQTTSLSTQTHHMDDLVQFYQRFVKVKNVPLDSSNFLVQSVIMQLQRWNA